MDWTDKRLDLERDGYIAIADLLTEQEVAWYLECYEAILSGKIDAGQWRSDLGSGQSRKREGVENITQVMWPSELIPDLLGSPAYHPWRRRLVGVPVGIVYLFTLLGLGISDLNRATLMSLRQPRCP